MSDSDMLSRIEALLVRERLFREDFERRLKEELRTQIDSSLRDLLLRFPIAVSTDARVLIHTVDGQRLVLDMREAFMAWHLIEHGAWEEPLREVIRRMLPKGGAFLDVGANIGAHAIFAGGCVGDAGLVVAVEPSPEIRSILFENFEINGLSRFCKVRDVAISDVDGETVTFEYFPKHPAMSGFTVSQERRELFSAEPERLQVRTATIDALVNNMGRTPDLVKMDIEGFELQALRGAPKTLAIRDTAWLIEFERKLVHATLGADAPERLWTQIGKAGLKAYPVAAPMNPVAMDASDFTAWVGGDLLLLHPGSAAEARAFG